MALRTQMREFRAMEAVIQAAPNQQISLTDPDAHSMATSGKGTGIIGYNVRGNPPPAKAWSGVRPAPRACWPRCAEQA